MEKRYQVFISSTFQDLQNARQEVSQALLRADCFPAGMELFPAADEEQFEFIKTIIDQSDYYILISAGRYGSIHPETGLSYTEMEYDYAVEVGKPVIRLLHRDPANTANPDLENKDSLKNFRTKMLKGALVNFWNNESELASLTVLNLSFAIKEYPTKGWGRPKSSLLPDGGLSRIQQRLLEIIANDSNLKAHQILNQCRISDSQIRDMTFQLESELSVLFKHGLIYINADWLSQLNANTYEVNKQTLDHVPIRITEFGRFILTSII